MGTGLVRQGGCAAAWADVAWAQQPAAVVVWAQQWYGYNKRAGEIYAEQAKINGTSGRTGGLICTNGNTAVR